MSEHTIPSIATILQSTDVLSHYEASATVVNVGGRFAVKFGKQVSLLEAQNMDYVATHSDVPVPKVHGTMTDEQTGQNFVVMDMVQGETLGKAWPTLTTSERRDVVDQLKRAIFNLRSMPPPGYIGSVAHQPCADGIFWVPSDQSNPLISGPFDTEDNMNQGILQKLESKEAPSYVALVRRLLSETLYGHKVVFTHGDLQPKNIMVQRADATADGTTSLRITIIDWEISGWYPEYWEFCNASITGRFAPDWLDTVQSIMQIYPLEYLMMQLVRHLLFY